MKIKEWIKNSIITNQHIRIKLNQRSIIQFSKSTQNIALNPVAPVGCHGNIERYYHFIFDLLLPLSFLISKTPSNVIFSLQEFGILTPILTELFKNRIRIQPNFDEFYGGKRVNLIGINPKVINIKHFRINTLKKIIYTRFNIDPIKKPNKILLIERLSPDPYYLNDTKVIGGGSLRRSIKNHEHLKQSIMSNVSPNYEFHNLKLENMSFEDQIRYFNSAVMVIAQHGAGLANILWMPKKSIVIEFGHNSKDHFKKISLAMKHHYFLFDNIETHIEINCLEFLNWLFHNRVTQNFLKERVC